MESPHEINQRASLGDVLTSDTISVIMKEYDALRAEILKRVEIMNQVASLALIVPGTIFAFGFQTQNATLILLYPILALFLSLIWSQSDRRIREIGYYINTRIESRFGDALGWEHFLDSTRTIHKLFDLEVIWASLGIFAGSEVLAILVGIPLAIKFGTLIPFIVLLPAAIISVGLTLVRLLSPYHHQERVDSYSNTLRKQKN